MLDDHEKRRIAEEEIRDPKKRATEKPNLAVSAYWWLVGVLVLAFIVAAVV